jgi:hypothetical protein
VRQLGYDKGFSATPATSYPAVGVTNQTFPVTSDSTWKFATGEADLTLEDETNWHPATETDYDYKFSLLANPGHAERDVIITVTSSDEDFANRSFPIHQSGVAPYFTITSGSPTDFGAVGTPKAVGYMTNANQWKYTLATGHEDVIASATVEAGVVQTTTATPTTSASGSVTFTPSTSNVGWGGSTKETTATFTTAVGISGVDEDEPKVVTLRRTIPVAFDIAVDPASGNIPATATDVTVTANTNMKWWIQLESGSKDETADPSTYTTGDTKTVTIPARGPSVATSWMENGPTITVKAGYDAQTTVSANTPASYTYTQLPYWVNLSSYEPSSPTTSVTITVSTNAESVNIRLNVNNADGIQVDDTKQLSHGIGQMFALGTVTSDRTIAIVNDLTNNKIGEFTQVIPVSTLNILIWPVSQSCPAWASEPRTWANRTRCYSGQGVLAPPGGYAVAGDYDGILYKFFLDEESYIYSDGGGVGAATLKLCYMGVVYD